MLVIDHHLLNAQQTANKDLVNQTKTFVHLYEHTHTHRQWGVNRPTSLYRPHTTWWSSFHYLLRYLVYVDFCRLVPKGTETPCMIFGVSGPIFTKIAHNVAKIVPFIISESELRYSNRCEMPPCWIKVISQILPKIGCHGNVPKGIKKEVRIEKINANTFHFVKRSWKFLR